MGADKSKQRRRRHARTGNMRAWRRCWKQRGSREKQLRHCSTDNMQAWRGHKWLSKDALHCGVSPGGPNFLSEKQCASWTLVAGWRVPPAPPGRRRAVGAHMCQSAMCQVHSAGGRCGHPPQRRLKLVRSTLSAALLLLLHHRLQHGSLPNHAHANVCKGARIAP